MAREAFRYDSTWNKECRVEYCLSGTQYLYSNTPVLSSSGRGSDQNPRAYKIFVDEMDGHNIIPTHERRTQQHAPSTLCVCLVYEDTTSNLTISSASLRLSRTPSWENHDCVWESQKCVTRTRQQRHNNSHQRQPGSTPIAGPPGVSTYATILTKILVLKDSYLVQVHDT